MLNLNLYVYYTLIHFYIQNLKLNKYSVFNSTISTSDMLI